METPATRRFRPASAAGAGEAVVPASELASARAEIAKLQRVLRKKMLENEILKEAVEYAAERVDCAPAPVAPGQQMKSVCRALGLARSNVHVLCIRPASRVDGLDDLQQRLQRHHLLHLLEEDLTPSLLPLTRVLRVSKTDLTHRATYFAISTRGDGIGGLV